MCRSRKRFNPKKQNKSDTDTKSTSSKKIKLNTTASVPEDIEKHYRVIDFLLVFSTISSLVKCAQCDGSVQFKSCKKEGIGFQIQVKCANCDPRYIPSSEKNGNRYEINTRFAFTMRTLGLGLAGCNKFCGLMDIASSFVWQSSYLDVMKSICSNVKTTAEKFLLSAAHEENQKTRENSESDTLTVNNGECQANHTGPSGNMEVGAVIEMFRRSEKQYVGAKISNYIGDGDSKTFSNLVEAKPYGENFTINMKECVGHVQKRMGRRLRDLVKNTVVDKLVKTGKNYGKKRRSKVLGGKGKLTGKVINNLSRYYGAAIRHNCDSIQNMKDAIWATFYRQQSTDEKPQHDKCLSGENSWCPYKKALATTGVKILNTITLHFDQML